MYAINLNDRVGKFQEKLIWLMVVFRQVNSYWGDENKINLNSRVAIYPTMYYEYKFVLNEKN